MAHGALAYPLARVLRPAFAMATGSLSEARYIIPIRLIGGLDGLAATSFHTGTAHGAAIAARRPRANAAGNDALLIDAGRGLNLHSALAPLLPDFNNGDFRVLLGVGNAELGGPLNLSHEYNQMLQAVGGDPNFNGSSAGFMARALDVFDLAPMQAMGVGVNGGGEFRHSDPKKRPQAVESIESMAGVGSLDQIFGGAEETGIILDTARRLREAHKAAHPDSATTQQIAHSLERLEETTAFFQQLNSFTFPGLFGGYTNSSLGRGLLGIAKVIGSLDGEPRPRIFLTGYQSTQFDTHHNQNTQLTMHLSDFAQNLQSFIRDMKGLPGNVWRRVMIVTYSEFGRRVYENGEGGTDHGKGGVSFAIGGSVHGGVLMDDSLLTHDWTNAEYLPTSIHFQNVLAQAMAWAGFDAARVFDRRWYTHQELNLLR